ncbi:uncharacterized protein NEMAJ01_0454 [Nematocida major]|uniref:uncharacterized protein n=1 Tax=Nematocida major TaxID=1912982 RepID=UPI002007C0D5|nr:uncharacterized protein NEMAJ01_0454 [Nematocida major]KAH9385558.1 hypothetical protein NEMAJ01_0454 [Nematocida major]
MIFLTNANNLGEYALKILNSYYAESMLTPGVTQRHFLRDIAMFSAQSIVYFWASLFCLVSKTRKKHFVVKRCKLGSLFPKTARATKKQKVSESYAEKGPGSTQDQKERVEKIILIFLLAVLACLNILNKILQCKSLEYVSFPTMSIVRSFRLFPTPLGVVRNRRQRMSMLSILLATAGMYVYIFSCEERVESLHFLRQLVSLEDFRMLCHHDKIKIIRMTLQFMYYYTKADLLAGKGPEEESAYMECILSGKQPAQDYSLPVKDQAARYYRSILLLYGNKPIPEDKRAAREVFKRVLDVEKKRGGSGADQLALSFIKLICTRPNTAYFQAFLERRKFDAAFYLALHSWMEVAFEAGQIFLCKEFGIPYEFVTTAVSLLSATVGAAVVAGMSHSLENANMNIRKDMVMSSIIFLYIRLFCTKEFCAEMDDTRMGLQIGMKFFSLLLSVMFYGHDFNLGHVSGVFLMFIGCLFNINMHTILLSRWTLSGHIRRKCL